MCFGKKFASYHEFPFNNQCIETNFHQKMNKSKAARERHRACETIEFLALDGTATPPR